MAKKTRSTADGMMVERSSIKYEKPRPIFRVDEKDLPEIKEWTVGKKYKVELEVEMQSHSKGDEYGPEIGEKKKSHEARLKVLSIKECEKDGDEE